jgi:high-affinity iron transporter
MLILLLLIAVGLAAPVRGAPAAAARATAEIAPGLAAQAIETDLFAAEAALLAGDADSAAKAIEAASRDAARVLPLFTADAAIAPAVKAELKAASDAVARNDAPGLAIAHGQIWSMLVRGAYAQTLAAVAAGDAADAARWLLLRDFRLTTKFDRPNANATLAVEQLRLGKITPDDAAATIRADLLDT